jgi:pyridoxamine 5'-phosphate oxidase
MDFKECANFANEVHDCFLATVENDQPRVRPLGIWYADETGIYFQSQTIKAVVKQIEKNPKVEVCFHSREKDRVLRVYGKVKFITDKKTKAKCLADRPFLKDLGITEPGDPLLAVFHLYTGEAFFWTRADSMKEAGLPRIKF